MSPMAVGDAELVGVLHAAVDAIVAALAGLEDWGPAGSREGQHHCDLAADAAALAVLEGAGLGVWSEESGHHGTDSAIVVVLDPVDGSANASRGLPFYAASLCALDADGPRAAVVAHLAGGPRYQAIRGGGALRDGRPLRPSGCSSLGDAVVGINGWPSAHMGWRQYRALGSAALELCAVAEGSLDAYCDVSGDGLAPWDYLGALLVCSEAGALVAGLDDRALWVGDERRTLVAGATAGLAGELLTARRRLS